MSMRRRPLAAWLAIFAIALQALWPLVAQAKPKSVVLVPVCTVQGVTHYIELPLGGKPGEPQSDPRAASQHDHCSFCSSGGERVAPPANRTEPPVVAAAFGAPQSTERSFLESQKHSNARSRAPPAISR